MSNSFYATVVRRLMNQGSLTVKHKVLVVAGGPHDRDVLTECGITKATISNLDVRMDSSLYSPFEWSHQDAEKLTYADGEFDWCIEHNGLHHCHSPHKALLEMCRVAKKGVLIFEPYDNLIARLGILLGGSQEYEHAAVYHNGCKFGGVRNTPIPNYIYKWTRNEIRKTVLTNNPYGPHQFQFLHTMVIPWLALRSRKNKLPFLLVCAALPFLTLLSWLSPSQANFFAAVILIPDPRDKTFPWLSPSDDGPPALNKKWLEERYGPK
jgi:SAM-dependent methyltransferase